MEQLMWLMVAAFVVVCVVCVHSAHASRMMARDAMARCEFMFVQHSAAVRSASDKSMDFVQSQLKGMVDRNIAVLDLSLEAKRQENEDARATRERDSTNWSGAIGKSVVRPSIPPINPLDQDPEADFVTAATANDAYG